MKKSKIRKAIDAYCDDNGLEDTLILGKESYDEAIIGITDDGRIVYDYEKMAACLAKRSQGKAPIILEVSRKELLDIYG